MALPQTAIVKPPMFSGRNLYYQYYRIRNRPELILGVICLAVLAVLVLIPLFEIIHDSLTYQSYDKAYRPDAEVGAFTLFSFRANFYRTTFLRAAY